MLSLTSLPLLISTWLPLIAKSLLISRQDLSSYTEHSTTYLTEIDTRRSPSQSPILVVQSVSLSTLLHDHDQMATTRPTDSLS